MDFEDDNEFINYTSDVAASMIEEFYIKEIAAITKEDIGVENLILAGGKVLSLLLEENNPDFAFESKDWDIYLCAGQDNESTRVFIDIEEKKKRLLALESDGVIWNFSQTGNSFQFCTGNKQIDFPHSVYDAPKDILLDFDLNISRCLYDPNTGKFLVDETLVDFLSGEDQHPPEIIVHHTTRPIFTINRISKYHKRGFPINKDNFRLFVNRSMQKSNLECYKDNIEYISKWGYEGSK